MKFHKVLNEMPVESAATSRKQVPAGLKKLVSLGLAKKGDINLDYGGGKWDLGTEHLEDEGITNYVFDPYNRSYEHNNEVLETIQEKGGADTITLLNVLNVIPEKKERISVIRDALKYLRTSGKMLIQCYNSDSSGETKRTKDGWQLNQPISFYEEEIEESFPSVSVQKKGQYLIITK